ncbi:MAG: hypothetical protein M3347_16535, partial [Armatimonadota bacterium]|nr:hypothetical protein [Armatimonadota bacterium]
GYTTSTLAAGNNLVINATITPDSSLAPGSIYETTLSVRRNSGDGTVRDAVKLRTVVQPTADLLIKVNNEPGSAYAINNVYQSTPSGLQLREQGTATGATLVYLVKVENDSSTSRTFVVKATGASDANAVVKYRSGPTNITTDILDADGYTTISLAPGPSEVLAVEVTPTSSGVSGAQKDVSMQVFLDGNDSTVRDAVKVTTTVP